MKYLSAKCVTNAYMNFQGSMTNKSWGFLALLKQVSNIVSPGVTYQIDCNALSTFLEDTFCVSDDKKTYSGSNSQWYVMFSNKWYEFFQNQGNSTPNVFDIIAWAYRSTPFETEPTSNELLAKFANDFNIGQDLLNQAFSTLEKPLTFVESKYTELELQNELKQRGVSMSDKNLTAIKTTVKASPGELTRGPFIQPLYAALDTADYLLIGQSNFAALYNVSSPDEIRDIREDHRGAISDALSSYLTAIRTKPFLLLAGISGTGKSRIVRKLAQATDKIDTFTNPEDRWRLHSPANFELIQVKPNWHNSMDVVGFKSNIGNNGEHYEFTPFVEFIAKAWKYEDTPFFLCLDEMNLAPVEEYFAEFLSAIESRSLDGNSYETDPIIKPFREFGEKVAIEMIDHLLGEKMANLDDDSQLSHVGWRFLNKGLTLPKNLIVMGTVNMDETTFSFSRKVLDRAMSIEMNEVMYDDFLSGKTENDIPQLTEYNEDIVVRPINGITVKDGDSQDVIEFLKDINELLEGTPFKLGYRAANEALLYVASAKRFGCSDWKIAMDDFTLMKILSRIEGDESKLKTVSGEDLLNELSALLTNKYSFSNSSKTMKKLSQMITILDRDKFVSFWG